MTLWTENLVRLVAIVGEKLDVHHEARGEFDQANYSAYFERSRIADDEIKAFFSQEADASFTQRGAHEHVVRMAGIRSTSTSGWTGALQNWKRSAEAKIAKAAGEAAKP